MPHGRAGEDPCDGIGRLPLGDVRIARLRVNGDRLVVLRDVVVVLQSHAVEFQFFSLDFTLVVTSTIQTERLVHEKRTVHRCHEQLLGRG